MNKGFESRNSPRSLGIFAQGTVVHKAAEVERKNGSIRKRWAFTKHPPAFQFCGSLLQPFELYVWAFPPFCHPPCLWQPGCLPCFVSGSAELSSSAQGSFSPQRDIISQKEGQLCDMWKRWYVQKEYWQITPSCPKGKHYIREGWVPVCRNWINQISNV